MPVAIIRPDGLGSTDEWTQVGGSSKFDAVDPGDPVSHDDDTSYCTADAGGGANDTQDFTVGAMPGAAIGVRGVTAFMHWRTPNDNSQTMAMAGVLDGTAGTELQETKNSSGSYTSFSGALPRPGGGSWTLADLADSTLRIRGRAVTNPTIAALRITSFWLQVDYDTSPFDLEPFREVAARQIRLLEHTPETYKVVVPYEFLNYDLMDDIGLAHESISRASSVITNIQNHMLVDSWRRLYTQIISINDNLETMELTITLLNMEPYICTMWDTGTSPFDVNNDDSLTEVGQRRRGIAILNPGAQRTETRNDVAFIKDVSNNVSFVRLAKVLDGVAKSNNVGTLSEDAIGNDVLNSCFIDDTAGAPDGWTLTESTGSIAINTGSQLFEDLSDYSQQIVEITKGSGDTYLDRTFTTTAVNRRIAIWASKADEDTMGGWGYQRNDGDWWNDITETWGASLVLNQLRSSNDTWTRTVSKVIDSQAAGTGKIRIGFNSGLENDDMYLGQVMSYEDNDIIYSDVLTDNSAVVAGGVADVIFDEIDNASDGTDRQVMHPDRGTLRFTLSSYQDGADAIEEGTANRQILFTKRWNDDDERDEVALEKVSGQVRIAYRRFISGAEDALAFKDFTLVNEEQIINQGSGGLFNEHTTDVFGTRPTIIDGPTIAGSATAGSTIKAAQFFGEEHFDRSAALDSIANSKVGTCSFWIKTTDATADIILNNTGAKAQLQTVVTTGTSQLALRNAAGTIIMVARTSVAINDGVWHHVGISWDLGGGPNVQVYVDGVSAKTGSLTETDDTVSYTLPTTWSLGANVSAGNRLVAEIAELYFNVVTELDFSNTTNLHKFIDSEGKPVPLGTNGETPTGTAPTIYFTVIDPEYEIATRWTSPSLGELGLSARTLSVFVDREKGTDDQATAVHSTSTAITQLYVGSTTSGIGLKNAGNYLRNWEIIQRAIPDEEILGRRP